MERNVYIYLQQRHSLSLTIYITSMTNLPTSLVPGPVDIEEINWSASPVASHTLSLPVCCSDLKKKIFVSDELETQEYEHQGYIVYTHSGETPGNSKTTEPAWTSETNLSEQNFVSQMLQGSVPTLVSHCHHMHSIKNWNKEISHRYTGHKSV
jgi:hypothetical protein